MRRRPIASVVVHTVVRGIHGRWLDDNERRRAERGKQDCPHAEASAVISKTLMREPNLANSHRANRNKARFKCIDNSPLYTSAAQKGCKLELCTAKYMYYYLVYVDNYEEEPVHKASSRVRMSWERSVCARKAQVRG